MTQSGIHPPQNDWIARWQRVARRIRVPLGFATAALYLFELWRRVPQPAAVAWSLALVLPRPLAARLRSRIRQKEPRADRVRPLCVHPQPTLSGINPDRRRFCTGFAQLARSGGSGCHVFGDLYPRDRLGRAVSFALPSPVSTNIAIGCPA